MQWVILDDSLAIRAVRPPAVGPPALMTIDVTDALQNLPLSSLPAEASDARSAQAADQASLGAMYGRYRGQIRARIDRAWQRPRTAIGAPIFQCQVRVDQDNAGRVREVTLLECNGGARWQLSLVHAIDAASPLPAPPNPKVFVHEVVLAFRAIAYSPAVPAQLYEPPGASRVNYEPDERGRSSQNAFQALRQAARAQKSQAVELRIEGSKVEVEPDRQ